MQQLYQLPFICITLNFILGRADLFHHVFEDDILMERQAWRERFFLLHHSNYHSSINNYHTPTEPWVIGRLYRINRPFSMSLKQAVVAPLELFTSSLTTSPTIGIACTRTKSYISITSNVNCNYGMAVQREPTSKEECDQVLEAFAQTSPHFQYISNKYVGYHFFRSQMSYSAEQDLPIYSTFEAPCARLHSYHIENGTLTAKVLHNLTLPVYDYHLQMVHLKTDSASKIVTDKVYFYPKQEHTCFFPQEICKLFNGILYQFPQANPLQKPENCRLKGHVESFCYFSKKQIWCPNSKLLVLPHDTPSKQIPVALIKLTTQPTFMPIRSPNQHFAIQANFSKLHSSLMTGTSEFIQGIQLGSC